MCSWNAGVSRSMPPLKSVATGAGGDRVDGDAARAELRREVAREHLDGALDRAVDGALRAR